MNRIKQQELNYNKEYEMNLDITAIAKELINELQLEEKKLVDMINGVVLLHDKIARHIESQKSVGTETKETESGAVEESNSPTEA